MNSRELQVILLEIEKKEGKNLSQVASAAGVDRSYLSKFVNLDDPKPVTDKLLFRLQIAFPGYFGGNNKTNSGGDDFLKGVLQSLSDSYKILVETHREVVSTNKILALNVNSTVAAPTSQPALEPDTNKKTVKQVQLGGKKLAQKAGKGQSS